MGSLIVQFIVAILTNLVKAWFGNEQIKKGAILEVENNAQAKAIEVIKAGNAVKPLTADELPNHTQASDPDFRD